MVPINGSYRSPAWLSGQDPASQVAACPLRWRDDLATASPCVAWGLVQIHSIHQGVVLLDFLDVLSADNEVGRSATRISICSCPIGSRRPPKTPASPPCSCGRFSLRC